MRDGTILSMESFVDMEAGRGIRPTRPGTSSPPFVPPASGSFRGDDEVATTKGQVADDGSSGGLGGDGTDADRMQKADDGAGAAGERPEGGDMAGNGGGVVPIMGKNDWSSNGWLWGGRNGPGAAPRASAHSSWAGLSWFASAM